MVSSAASTTAIVLAAGQGTRMKSSRPKVMHEIAGRAMVLHVTATIEAAGIKQLIGVIGPDMDVVKDSLAPHPTFVQTDRLGTAHAVLAAKTALQDAAQLGRDILVMFGDAALITPVTIEKLIQARQSDPAPGVVVLGFEPDDPGAYGRLITGPSGELTAIVEAADATPEQLACGLCNSGVMLIDGTNALTWLERIDNKNAKGEYYLTDVVAIAIADGATCAAVSGPTEEMMGVNSRSELAEAEQIMQERQRRAAMDGGVTMTDPASVFLSWDTKLGKDVTIGPDVVFGPGVDIADDVEVRAFSHIEGARVESGAVIGPFARLRPGARIGEDARVGNFVEIKNAVLGIGAKANHLTYVGDAEVGAAANIGAGTITCNYDGYFKSKTIIGEGAFIGSNTALVAPVEIGAGAIVGAGSTIAKGVPGDALSLTRADQRTLNDWAKRFNQKQAAKKARAKKGE